MLSLNLETKSLNFSSEHMDLLRIFKQKKKNAMQKFAILAELFLQDNEDKLHQNKN
jgi:hypothetical protein